MFERLVATVTGLSKTIDRIDLYEATDVSAVDSRPMLIDLMGMGRPPEDVTVDSPIIKKLDMAYRQALNATADVLGIDLSHIEVSVDATTLPTTSRWLAGTIEAGTVVGQRFSWVGHWSGRAVARDPRGVGTHSRPAAVGAQTAGPRREGAADSRGDQGRPQLRSATRRRLGRQVPTGQHAQPGHLMIAMGAVRAIPYVLAQPPGIVTAPVFGAIQLAGS